MTHAESYYIMRRGGMVNRFHQFPMNTRQVVSSHSWGVAMLCYVLSDSKGLPVHYPSSELLLCALTHDIAEQVTGDIPAPVKWGSVAISKVIGKMEDDFNRDLFWRPIGLELSEEEQLIFKWADGLEGMFTCYDELFTGNKMLLGPFHEWALRLTTLPPHTIGLELREWVIDAWNKLTNENSTPTE